MSIVADVSDKCTPAECYVLDRSAMVTLPEYLHSLLLPDNLRLFIIQDLRTFDCSLFSIR